MSAFGGTSLIDPPRQYGRFKFNADGLTLIVLIAVAYACWMWALS